MYAPVGVEPGHLAEKFCASCLSRKLDERAFQPRLLTCGLLVPHVDGAGRIVSYQNRGQVRDDAGPTLEFGGVPCNFPADAVRNLSTVDDLCRHDAAHVS